MENQQQALCEIRVPTYKRPVMLKRALESIQQQTYSHWKAIVLDDSTDREAESVVEKMEDDRIQYRPNEQNLGGCGNIDRAFSPESLAGGTYAAILEDDNWWYPEFLEHNLAVMQQHNVDIMLRNQAVWNQYDEGDDKENMHRTTRGRQFTEGVMQPMELRGHLFYCEGISNGGLFWKLNEGVDLWVGPTVDDTGLQEYCRTLQIDRPIYYGNEPLAVWSRMENDLVIRKISNRRRWSRGRQSVMRYLLKTHGEEIVEVARNHVKYNQKHEDLQRALTEAFYLIDPNGALRKKEQFKLLAKATAKYWLVADPLETYFQEKQLPDV